MYPSATNSKYPAVKAKLNPGKIRGFLPHLVLVRFEGRRILLGVTRDSQAQQHYGDWSVIQGLRDALGPASASRRLADEHYDVGRRSWFACSFTGGDFVLVTLDDHVLHSNLRPDRH